MNPRPEAMTLIAKTVSLTEALDAGEDVSAEELQLVCEGIELHAHSMDAAPLRILADAFRDLRAAVDRAQAATEREMRKLGKGRRALKGYSPKPKGRRGQRFKRTG